MKDLGVTAPMVVKEFIRRRVAPLQPHSRPMWTLSGGKDRMRLHGSGLPLEVQQTVLEILTGDWSPANMPEEGCLLYCFSNRVEFGRQMPPFNEWGLRPVVLVGPRENPIIVVPFLAPAPILPQEWTLGGKHCRRPVARVPRCRCCLRLPRRHPREPVIPTLGRQLQW